MNDRTYIAIDLKSFYASVECMERGLNPMETNLVVADKSRTEKTICLAVSPSLKACGIPGRPRLFEVVQKVKEINTERKRKAPGGVLCGTSCFAPELKANPKLALDYVVAPPRMEHYMKCSTDIYRIYLEYIAPEDIHVYSIDEVFLDVTEYLGTYGLSARELAATIMQKVFTETGITATAGIVPNLYLCKVAMDIWSKHIPADKNGVRIASLDEMSYRRLLWSYKPLTDFWRIGRGYAEKLNACGLYTMGDIAKCSLGGPNDYYNEDLLYKMFGVNAELLIDHAWGYEPCTLADVKAYKPDSSSKGMGQVLKCPYEYDKAKIVVREMAELLALDLAERGLVTDQIVLTIGYDRENLKDMDRKKNYRGEVTADRYGRPTPKHAHGTEHIGRHTFSARLIWEAAERLLNRIADKNLLVRRICLTADHVIKETEAQKEEAFLQLDLFTDYKTLREHEQREEESLKRERNLQLAMLEIRKKYGKNAILKGLNLWEGATAIERNNQIGGHRK